MGETLFRFVFEDSGERGRGGEQRQQPSATDRRAGRDRGGGGDLATRAGAVGLGTFAADTFREVAGQARGRLSGALGTSKAEQSLEKIVTLLRGNLRPTAAPSRPAPSPAPVAAPAPAGAAIPTPQPVFAGGDGGGIGGPPIAPPASPGPFRRRQPNRVSRVRPRAFGEGASTLGVGSRPVSPGVRQATRTVVAGGARAFAGGAAVPTATSAGGAAAAGGALAALGPLAVAAGAVVVVFGALVGVAKAVNETMRGLNDRIAPFSGPVSRARARADVERTRQSIELASDFGSVSARNIESREELSRELFELRTRLLVQLEPVLSTLAERTSDVLQVLNGLLASAQGFTRSQNQEDFRRLFDPGPPEPIDIPGLGEIDPAGGGVRLGNLLNDNVPGVRPNEVLQ